MRIQLGRLSLVAVALVLGASSAFAAPRLSLVGVGTMGMPQVTYNGTSLTGNSVLGYQGGGALVEFHGAGHWGLEIGAIYADFKSKATGIYM
jgi:hypothetical protein